MIAELALRVTEIDDSIPGIRTLTLADPAGRELPSFTPGSHVVLHCGPVSNAYSLTGSAVAPLTYAVSVQRIGSEQGGHGGSTWVHDVLGVGDVLTALAPRSSFAPIRHARRHLYIAGGIGITPMVSHLRSAARWGDEVEVVHVHREGCGAYQTELRALAGERVTTYTDPKAFVAELTTLLTRQPIGTHLYLCGPPSLMDLVRRSATDAGWPAGRIHLEHFGVGALAPGSPFEVVVTGTGTTVAVPSGVSLLDALERSGHQVANMCRQGVCGECRIGVTAGAIDHRDLFLDDEEKAGGAAMMCCVSRAAGTQLVVTL